MGGRRPPTLTLTLLGSCPWLFDLQGTVRAVLVAACHQNKQDKLRLGLRPVTAFLESLTSLVALGEECHLSKPCSHLDSGGGENTAFLTGC